MLLRKWFSKIFIAFSICVIPFLSFSSQLTKLKLTDAQVRKILIQHSIEKYPGSCACPYQRDKAGRLCGRRSAWSRYGGYHPLCYPSDVTPKMIQDYRR